MKKYAILLLLIGLTATFANAQFPIKIPKIKIPIIEQPKPENTPQPPNNSTQNNQPNNSVSDDFDTKGRGGLNRQMVMDDGVTFFDAEPIAGRDAKTNREIDTGWFMKSHLRIFGVFPKRSAFRITVKKNGQQMTSTRCEGAIFTKRSTFASQRDRDSYNEDFEDFMSVGDRCFDKAQVNTGIGKFDVEIYFIDGDTDKETLVRTHKIDVHKATRILVSNSIVYPDVADYYIQRHAESAVAIAYFTLSQKVGGIYFQNNGHGFTTRFTRNERNGGHLSIYTNFSPDGTKGMPANPHARCSVNGQKVNLSEDTVYLSKNLDRREMATHSKRGFSERVEFNGLSVFMPIKYLSDETPDGKWECDVIENGVTFRTFRFELQNGELVMHPEQLNGNINLFHKAALIDMEIPAGGSRFDHRLLPMPNAGLFYAIPWTTAEGKAAVARLPKKGNPYHVGEGK